MTRSLVSSSATGRATRGLGLGATAVQLQGQCPFTCYQTSYFGWQLTTR